MPRAPSAGLGEMLQTAREQHALSEISAPPGADILLASVPRRKLARASLGAIEANIAAGSTLDLAHSNFSDTAQALRGAIGAPPREHINPPDDAEAAPSIAPLNDLLSLQEHHYIATYYPYAGLNADSLAEAAAAFDQANIAYTAAQQHKRATQQEADLASKIRTRRRQLVRTPRIATTLLITALLGGVSYSVNQGVEAHAQAQIAALKTTPLDNERYRALIQEADPRQVALMDAVNTLGGLAIGAGLAWALGGEMARGRAKLIVWRARHSHAPADIP